MLTFYVQRAYFFLSIAGLFFILIVDVKLAQILNEVLIFYLKISNVDITMQIQSNLILHSKSLIFFENQCAYSLYDADTTTPSQ